MNLPLSTLPWRVRLLGWANWAVWMLPLPVAVAGALLRAASLGASAFWYDEAYSLYLTRFSPLELVRLAARDFNPPLWELVAWPFVRIFGETEIGLRLPALLASLAALWLVWKLADLFGLLPVEKACAVALAALLPYQFWLAQDGRTYALMSALYLAALWFAMRRHYLGLAGSLGLLIFAHSTAVFYAASALAVAALATRRGDWRKLALAALAPMGAMALWAPAYLHAGQKHHWLGNLTTGLFNGGLLRIFFADALPNDAWGWLALITILISIGLAAYVSARWLRDLHHRPLGVLALAAVGPLVLMIAAALVKNVLFYRPMSALLAPLCLWFGAALPRWGSRVGTAVLGYTWAVLMVLGVLSWSPVARGGELRDLARQMDCPQCPGVIVYHATATSALPFSFYLRDQPHYLLDDSQAAGLLSDDLRDAFSLRRAPLESLPWTTAYVVWARDPLLSDQVDARMAAYVRGGTLIGTVHYWQAAPIQVWEVMR